MEMST